VPVVHSNGGDVLLRALARTEFPFAECHFFSAACESSFDKNGLNAWLAGGRVGRVVCYTAGRDRAMQLAKWSTRLFGWMGLGYGTLGLTGPRHVAPAVADRVVEVVEPEYGHSDWWTGVGHYHFCVASAPPTLADTAASIVRSKCSGLGPGI